MIKHTLIGLYVALQLMLLCIACSSQMVTMKAVRVDPPRPVHAADTADSALVTPQEPDPRFQALVRDGFMLYRQQRYDQAVVSLRQAVALHPDHWEPYYALGLVRNATEDYAVADAFLSESLDLAPSDNLLRCQIYLAQAQNYEAQSLYGRAEQSYRTALALHPESPAAQAGLQRLAGRSAP